MRCLNTVLAIAVAAGVAACGGGGGGAPAGTGPGPTVTLPKSRYDMANGCFLLKSMSTAVPTFAVHNGDGTYAATSADTTGAEPLFLKPTALGTYVMYARDATFLSAASSPVVSDAAPSDSADWVIDTVPSTPVPTTSYGNVDYSAAFAGDGVFHIFSAAAGQYLAVDASQNLVLEDLATAGNAALWSFSPFPGCTAYPEAALNETGATFTSPANPVIGFADVHQHISATTFLGGAHYGTPFHRFGITEALKDCQDVHGSNGQTDAVGNFLNNDPTGQHDTVGWPTFNDWPARHRLTHEATYYRWVERAYMAGLRLVMNNLVENQMLCKLQSAALGTADACNEMDEARQQAQFMHDLQDYVDAQSGGPGKGWFRIVTTPADARQVINQGKLAVVLGVEISHLFNCKLTDAGTAGDAPPTTYGDPDPTTCTTASIDTDLADLYSLGVRQMFPIHEFNNAFGGNGIFDGFVLNVGNKSDTGRYWETYDCPNVPYFFAAGANMTSVPPGPSAPDGSPTCYVAGTPGGATQCYPGPTPGVPQCNLRTMTPIGEYAVSRMMDYRMIVEVDHLELKMKDQVMDLALSRGDNAIDGVPYPVVSSHGGHGGITVDQVDRMINDLGGYVFDHQGNGHAYEAERNTLRAAVGVSDPDVVVPMGTGDDTNGLSTQSGTPSAPISYPFRLFTGAGDWNDPMFAGIQPMTFQKQVTGSHAFDYNAAGTNANGTDLGGIVHYGLVADWVEDVRQQGHRPALKALYSSAEKYLEVWEQTLNRTDRRAAPLYTSGTLPPIPNPDCHYGGTCP